MAIDLFFAGTQCPESMELIEKNQYCRLYSYYNDKKDLLSRFERNAKGKLFVDSGAFTAWTKGVHLDVDTYIEWLNTYKDHIYLAGQVDTIPGVFRQTPTKQQVEEAAQKTYDNYWYMRERLDNPDVLVYTFHVGENFKFLKEILNHPEVKYIALGGMVGKTTEQKENFCRQCFDIIKTSPNPNVKVHAFGMTSMSLLRKYPFTSADSTGWIMTGSTGNIFSDYGVLDISQKNKYSKSSILNLPKDSFEKLRKEIEEFGYTIEELENDYKARVCYNVKYMHKKSLEINCNKYISKRRLF